MKIKQTLFFFLFAPFILIAQSPHKIIDEVRKEICNKLNAYENFEEVPVAEKALTISKILLKHQDNWELELDAIEDSRNNGQTIFDGLLIHQLQLYCPLFSAFYPQTLNYLIDSPRERAQYFQTQNLIIKLEQRVDVKELMEFFDPSLRNDSLKSKLLALQKELVKSKDESIIYSFWSETADGSVIVTNHHHYHNGVSNAIIHTYFKDFNDVLLDGIFYRNKEQIAKDSENIESELPLDIPPPPPPPPISDEDD